MSSVGTLMVISISLSRGIINVSNLKETLAQDLLKSLWISQINPDQPDEPEDSWIGLSANLLDFPDAVSNNLTFSSFMTAAGRARHQIKEMILYANPDRVA